MKGHISTEDPCRATYLLWSILKKLLLSAAFLAFASIIKVEPVWSERADASGSNREYADPLYLDVRPFDEFITGHVPFAKNISLDQLSARLKELDAYKDRDIVVICAVGKRSAEAVKALKSAGFSKISHYLGGMKAWYEASRPINSRAILPYFADRVGALLQAIPIPDDLNPQRGILVRTVTVEGALDRAGFRSGDIITAINGKAPSKEALLNKLLLADILPGVNQNKKMQARVYRLGEWLTLTIDPSARTSNASRFNASQNLFLQTKDQTHAVLQAKLINSEIFKNYAGLVDGLAIFLNQWGATALSTPGYLLSDPQQVSRIPSVLIPELGESIDLIQVMHSAVTLASRELQLKPYLSQLKTIPRAATLEQVLLSIDAALLHHKSSVAESLKLMTKEEQSLLRSGARKFFDLLAALTPLLQQATDQAALSEAFRLREASRKFRLQPLLEAFSHLTSFIEGEYIDSLRSVLREAAPLMHATSNVGVTGKILALHNTPSGQVVIGAEGNNIYVGKFAAIIDFAGDDEYNFAADGAPILLIDLSGNDIYNYNKTFTAASYDPVVRLMYDISGDDSYRSADLGSGSAVYGISVSLDGAGEDAYYSEAFSQGAASFGIGILIDQSGSDKYEANASSQGFGGVGGVGMLIDRSGDDIYAASGSSRAVCQECGYTQGAGYGVRSWSYGGIGMLFDISGDDQYTGKNYTQGTGYEGGLGFLYDRTGNDRYISGRFGAGAGVHKAIGVLYDQDGNDEYKALDIRAQGTGWDLGIGYLLDSAGDDKFIAKAYSQGAGSANSYGILLDKLGNDYYFCESKTNCQGYGMPEQPVEHGPTLRRSIGALLDLGAGHDQFTGDGLKNHFKRDSSEKGFFSDE